MHQILTSLCTNWSVRSCKLKACNNVAEIIEVEIGKRFENYGARRISALDLKLQANKINLYTVHFVKVTQITPDPLALI